LHGTEYTRRRRRVYKLSFRLERIKIKNQPYDIIILA
jgi:hypothetical protein